MKVESTDAELTLSRAQLAEGLVTGFIHLEDDGTLGSELSSLAAGLHLGSSARALDADGIHVS